MLIINPKKPEIAEIKTAVKVIQSGGLIAYPTDTLYGLGTNALNPSSVLKVFEAKKRPLDQALPLIVSGLEMANELAFVTDDAKRLIKAFWPGALTIILKRKSTVPSVATGGRLGVGLRAPNHPVPLAIARISGLPLVATSANRHGGANSVDVSDVLNQLGGCIDLILDGGRTKIGIASTIIDLTRAPPLIVRKGPITKEMVEEIIGYVET